MTIMDEINKPSRPIPIQANHSNKANYLSKTISTQANLMNPMNPNPLGPINQSTPIISTRVESKSKPTQCQASNPSNQPNHINHPNQSIHSTPCQISMFKGQSNYSIIQRRRQTISNQSVNECNHLKTRQVR